IGLLCRFRSPAEQRKTLQDFSKGLVDIIIGTHRVLSKDIKPKALGLLIIDEEQRFGVKHKEKLKELKRDVNVLTLTATPIPRTLHMSLAGIRELSILKEPPMDRHPIQTYVMEYSEETVREAIRRELSRGGQVYFVYNRVNGIAEVAAQIRWLLPDAEVAYAHGQMNERELEQIMLDFMNGDIDVLVSTTIIETGLDIPNVNTIIIQDADRLGLSQLYQLRGRVGRSSRTAYAFLLYRRGRLLTEEAEKRLKAIREFTELGSGIRIAMRDLEIRGAGNVLGAEQHGHMQAVGYDMYCKLLNQAVRLLTGKEEPEEQFQTTVEADADAYIPDTYIKYEDQKLDIYKRIALVETDEDDLSMQDELMDRFGEIPRPVRNLLLAARIRSAAHRVFVTEVKITRQEAQLLMIADAQLNVDAIPDLVKQYRGKLSVRPGEQVRFILTESEKYFDGTPMLEKTLKLLREMETLIPENA
ncbi:MAG: transcription-repair coupling factor, partial [Stomatobaculum sp.]|nr:transcription-repair coupling factor [Stomatobaculum sp.]